MTPIDECPKCGSKLAYDEVDIDVGVQRGNYHCPDCGWQPPTLEEMLVDDGEVDLW